MSASAEEVGVAACSVIALQDPAPALGLRASQMRGLRPAGQVLLLRMQRQVSEQEGSVQGVQGATKGCCCWSASLREQERRVTSDVHTCCIVADPHCCPEVPGSATIGDGAPKPFVCPFGVLMWLWYGPADSGGRATCAAAGASMVQRVKGGCRLNRSLSINRASSDAAGRSRLLPGPLGRRLAQAGRLSLLSLDPILILSWSHAGLARLDHDWNR